MAIAKKSIRVLFLSNDRAMNDFTGTPARTGWYETALATYSGDRLTIGLAYPTCFDDEVRDKKPGSSLRARTQGSNDSLGWSCEEVGGITYYAVDASFDVVSTDEERATACRVLMDVVEEFKPDVIQVLGCEWPYGAIAEDVNVPVVIHMMGFLNIYFCALDMVNGYSEGPKRPGPLGRLLHGALRLKTAKGRQLVDGIAAFERHTMRVNHFFMGRTEWDKNIVTYYSPEAKYYHVPEFISWPFIRGAGTWRYHGSDKLRLLTVSSADDRKGNEIILRTAKLLKELAGVEFEWKVAGHKNSMLAFERRTGIKLEDVNVRLLGMIEREQIVRELQEADLFIHPSIVDNSPNTICESQLVGCPVIASYVGGVPQLVQHGVTGYLYPYNEPHTLAFLIANLVGERDELTRVSEAESKLARERHDPVVLGRRYVEVYEDVLRSYHEQSE